MKVNGILCHDTLAAKMEPMLSYNEERDYTKWKESIRDKFIELTGIDFIEQNSCPMNFQIESEVKKEGYRQIRFTITDEINNVVPCYILIPDGAKDKLPLVITLQGHASGFHNSVGEPKYPCDEAYQPRGAFAVQAVKEGYIALAIEQRAMGETRPLNSENRRVALSENPEINMCYYQQMTGILMGRTLVGERCVDVKNCIDAVLANFPEVDEKKIAITGNSGGGTASYYAACYDKRIKICMPSCAFCPYPESILRFYHCSCNYIPSAFRYFDMQDLSCLIAPRKLSIISGKLDPSFLIDGVRRGFETVKKVYKCEKVEDNCKLIETEKGHYWCVDVVWPEMKRLLGELK